MVKYFPINLNAIDGSKLLLLFIFISNLNFITIINHVTNLSFNLTNYVVIIIFEGEYITLVCYFNSSKIIFLPLLESTVIINVVISAFLNHILHFNIFIMVKVQFNFIIMVKHLNVIIYFIIQSIAHQTFTKVNIKHLLLLLSKYHHLIGFYFIAILILSIFI